MNYFYSIDGLEVQGPYSQSELSTLLNTGSIPNTAQVCIEGEQLWTPISDLSEFNPKPAKQSSVTTPQAYATPKIKQSSKPSSLLIPFVIVLVLLLTLLAGGAYYLGIRSKSTMKVSSRDTPSTPMVPESYRRFVQVSRLMQSAIGTGISFTDFHKRLIEVNASATEVLEELKDDQARRDIAAYTLALNDAFDIWKYKVTEDKTTLKLEKGKYGANSYTFLDFQPTLGRRWVGDISGLADTYGFQQGESYDHVITDNPRYSELHVDAAIQKIFSFSSDKFEAISKKR